VPFLNAIWQPVAEIRCNAVTIATLQAQQTLKQRLIPACRLVFVASFGPIPAKNSFVPNLNGIGHDLASIALHLHLIRK